VSASGTVLLAPDPAVPERDALLAPTTDALPVPATSVEVLRCKYRVGESLRVVYRVDGVRLISVRAGGGRRPRWWVFPNDRRLRDLRALLQPEPMWSLAASLGWHRSEVVEYAPERSLTVRAVDRSGATVGYAKRYAPGSRDVGALAARYAATATHLGASPVSSPRPLAWAADLLVLEAMRGTMLAELGVVADRAARLGLAIASLHGASPPPAAPAFDRLTAGRLSGAAAAIERAIPDLADGTRGLLDALLRRDRPTRERVFLHGDYHPKNTLVDGDHVALIDLDQAGTGPAAADLGGFVARGCVATLLGRQGPLEEASVASAFLAGYASVRRAPTDAELRWHTAAALLGEQAVRAVSRVRADVLAVLPSIVERAHEVLG
jgi:aminoglycoside phosphotransferase